VPVIKITFITNICIHCFVRLFELLSRKYDVNFCFTGGDERYWNKKNKTMTGDFQGKNLKGYTILPGIKFMPELLGLPFKKTDIFIKTLDGRVTLPFVFLSVKLLRKPFILWTGLWSHPETFLHKISFPFTKFIYNHSDAILVYGDHVKEYLIGLGVQSEKIFCAYHSSDNTVLNKDVSQDETLKLRNQLGFTNEKVVLYVGRLEDCKGLDFLIQGLANIKDPEFTLLFVGNGSQGDEFRIMCEELSVKCHFTGHVPNQDLYQYYALADIFVLPSVTTKDFKEPWGLVINEAMNQGCPIVTTDAVGAAVGGLVENGRNGYIVPEKNSQALQGAVEKLLSNEKQRLEMGRRAKEKISQWTPQETMGGFVRAIDFVNVS